MQKKPEGPQPFTQEELQKIQKFEEEHERRMATDPKYKKDMEATEKFLSEIMILNDYIED